MSGPLGSQQWMYASGGYQIEGSLRFNDDDSAYLSRTPAAAGNRKTWTWSAWVKRGNLETFQRIFNCETNNNNYFTIQFTDADEIRMVQVSSGSIVDDIKTSAKYRDTSAWYHFTVVADTTDAVASNRLKIYVNGVQETSFQTSNYPGLNADLEVNQTIIHRIGTGRNDEKYFDGYMSDIYFIDGQALDPTSFGETIDGYWRAIPYDGTYGTNGFHLEFDGAVTDSSGNGNDWTANNISAHDYVPDSPTNNWSVINSQVTRGNATEKTVFSEGNLKVQGQTSGTASQVSQGTIQFPATGKYYFEVLVVSSDSASAWHIGIGSNYNNLGTVSDSEVYYREDGDTRIDVTNSAYGASYTAGDIIGVSVNLDDDEVEFLKNNSSQGVISHTLSSDFIPMLLVPPTADQAVLNFGQDSTFAGATTAGGNTDANGIGDFKYAPPAGYLALCTANLPTPTIVDGFTSFSTVLYSGSNSAQSITGVGFQPDWVWLKNRNYGPGVEHVLTDSVRGATKRLESNTPDSELTQANDLQSFDADGFTVGGGQIRTSASGYNYVAWNWKAGTSFSNSAGTNGATIASSGSVNTDAGFSIVSYTGNGTDNATVGHGLNQTPDIVIIKNRDDSRNWTVWGNGGTLTNVFTTATSGLELNTTDGMESYTTVGTDLLTTTFRHNDASFANNNLDDNYIAYCFHSVDGFSKVGYYTGNSELDERSPYINTGFRPAWVMIKKATSGSTGSWVVFDSVRSIYNPSDIFFYANEPDDEYSGSRDIDFLSNGFKIRNTAVNLNNSNDFVFLAFAETPFKYANAR